VGVHPLNRRHLREHAPSGMVHDIHQQPRDGPGIRRVRVSQSFAADFAAVFQLPRWTGGMASDDLTVSIRQFGVGRLQGPYELAIRSSPTSIDLESRGMGKQNNLFTGSCSDRSRDFGRRLLLCVGEGELEEKSKHNHTGDRCRSMHPSSHRDIVAGRKRAHTTSFPRSGKNGLELIDLTTEGSNSEIALPTTIGNPTAKRGVARKNLKLLVNDPHGAGHIACGLLQHARSSFFSVARCWLHLHNLEVRCRSRRPRKQYQARTSQVATGKIDARAGVIQQTPRLNLVAARGLEPRTYGL
jgi:hypothetical protein